MGWTRCKQLVWDTFPKRKGLCKVWALLLRHHLHPQVQQHRRTASRQRVTRVYGQSSHHLLLAQVHSCVHTRSPTAAMWLLPLSQPLHPCVLLPWHELSTITIT